jgi:pyrroline-5-carboxylate reductase
MKIGIIGGGNLGSSLARGLLKSGALKAKEIIVSDPDERKLKELENLGIKTTTDNRKLVKDCDVVFIAIKHGIMEAVLKEVEDISKDKLFVSMAAGVPIKFIEGHTKARIIRVMPNICGAVAEMASCFSFGRRATPNDGELVERLLGSMGATFKVEENLIDAVTGVSGSGPAYFYLFIKALQEVGVELGLSSEVALKLAAQTAKGAGGMLLATGVSPDDLIKQVCTPKGTTIEAIKVLENRKVAEAIKDAVKADVKRAKELSG